MAKAQRFPIKVETWVPNSFADAFELLASDGLLTMSDHVRLAMRGYLHQMGALPVRAPQAVNGQHHPQAAE